MEGNYNLNSTGNEEAVTLPLFKDIRKPTINETYKYFKKLIHKKPIRNLKESISLSTELSLFDESLRLMLIDCSHLKDEAVKILLSQNELQIKSVLQWEWLFQDLQAEFCTTQMFPYVSLSLRCKIINRLSKYLKCSKEAEKYFEFIRANYDNSRADFILPRCSPQFILNYLEKTNFTFNFNSGLRIFLNICKRYPEVGVQVLSGIFDRKRETFHNFSKYRNVMRYLAGHHPDLMVPFLKKYSTLIPGNTFGRKLTKKLGEKLRENSIQNFIKNSVFREKTLFSILGAEEQVKFIAAIVRFRSERLSPRNWTESEQRMASLLMLVPAEDRLAMIEAAFREVYKLNFNEHPKFWGCHLLELLPTKTREPYVAKLEELAEGDGNVFLKNLGRCFFSPECPEELLYLYDSSVAFEKLKEVIRKTPAAHRREAILTHLVKSCRINKDLKILQEVVEFVAARHRNDDQTVIFRFMEAILDSFPASAMNSAIFEKLEDLAYFCSLKGRPDDFLTNRWREKHIHYRLENKLRVESQAKTLFESVLQEYYPYPLVVDLRSKHARFLILAAGEEAVPRIQKQISDESHAWESLLTRVLDTCKEYNRLNKNRRIFFEEISGLKEILQEQLRKCFGEVGSETWSLDIWNRYYGDVRNSCYKPKCLFYLLKRRPELVDKHLEGILRDLFSNYFGAYKGFFEYLKRTASFFGKTEKLKEIILNEFKTGESIRRRKTALELYSLTCSVEEFSEAIEKYIPQQEKVEKRSDEEGFDEIQMLVPSLVRHVRPRWKNLELIVKFFFGDFLKSVLPSLYSCCYDTRCDLVVPFLKRRLEEVPPRVSYVKDLIRLVLELSDRRGRAEFCWSCWNQHKHYSVRSIVLRYASQLFLEQPSKESFRVLEKFVLDSDEATVDALPELDKIPKEFFNDYVSALWKFSELQKPNFRVNYRRDLLGCFNENNVGFLSREFCESMIKNNLFNPSSSGVPVVDFTVTYLARNLKAVERIAQLVLDQIKTREASAYSVGRFFNALIAEAWKKPGELEEAFAIFLDNWPEFPLGVLYEERVLFSYHNLHQKVVKRRGGPDAVEFGKELRVLFSKVENLNDLLPIYAEALKSFFNFFQTSNAIVALKELAAGSRDRHIGILVVLALPPEAIEWHKKERIVVQENIIKGKKDLNELFGTLLRYSDSIVEIYLRSKFE